MKLPLIGELLELVIMSIISAIESGYTHEVLS